MIQTKVANELRVRNLNSIACPQLSGLPHSVLLNPKPEQPEINWALENHLLCTFAITKASNYATEICIDYKRCSIHFLKRGELVQMATFESLKLVSKPKIKEGNELIVSLAGVTEMDSITDPEMGAPFTLWDIGLQPLDSFDEEEEAVVATLEENYSSSSVPYVRSHSRSQSRMSSVSGVSNTDRMINAVPFADDDFEQYAHLSIELYFRGALPVKFVCSNISQMENLFDRLKFISRDSFAQLKNLPEVEVVLHYGFARRPTRSGMFSKKVIIVIIPGRLLEFEVDAPEPLSMLQSKSESYANLVRMSGSFTVPFDLTHSNICPKNVITVFNSHPPDFDAEANKIFFETFVPNPLRVEYKFSNREEAIGCFKALCFCRDFWNYQEKWRKLNSQIRVKSDVRPAPKLQVVASTASTVSEISSKASDKKSATPSSNISASSTVANAPISPDNKTSSLSPVNKNSAKKSVFFSDSPEPNSLAVASLSPKSVRKSVVSSEIKNQQSNEDVSESPGKPKLNNSFFSNETAPLKSPMKTKEREDYAAWAPPPRKISTPRSDLYNSAMDSNVETDLSKKLNSNSSVASSVVSSERVITGRIRTRNSASTTPVSENPASANAFSLLASIPESEIQSRHSSLAPPPILGKTIANYSAMTPRTISREFPPPSDNVQNSKPLSANAGRNESISSQKINGSAPDSLHGRSRTSYLEPSSKDQKKIIHNRSSTTPVIGSEIYSQSGQSDTAKVLVPESPMNLRLPSNLLPQSRNFVPTSHRSSPTPSFDQAGVPVIHHFHSHTHTMTFHSSSNGNPAGISFVSKLFSTSAKGTINMNFRISSGADVDFNNFSTPSANSDVELIQKLQNQVVELSMKSYQETRPMQDELERLNIENEYLKRQLGIQIVETTSNEKLKGSHARVPSYLARLNNSRVRTALD